MPAGVDGCRAGWAVALDAGGGAASLHVVASFADVLALGAGVVAVDMPIGLPAAGPRACDVEARARLGPRRSSVFPAPPRAVLGARDHADATARARAATGRGMSLQTWHLVAKVAEVDELVHPGDPVVEAHPELSFATLAGGPLATAKRSSAGRDERLRLLAPVVPGAADVVAARPPRCAADDALDALVLLWTARRVVAGTAVRLGDGACDERGLPMAVTA